MSNPRSMSWCRSSWVLACAACTALVTVIPYDERTGLPTRGLALAAIAALAWAMVLHPPTADDLVRRAVHAWTRPALVGAAGVLAVLLVAGAAVGVGDRGNLVGLLGAAIVLSTYLATWGHRSPARLRWTIVMSALLVPGIAAPLLDMFESTTRLVSEMVYRRLGTVELFGVREEPWKLFSAMPHSGSLLVLTVLVIGSAMCVTRGMSLLATAAQLAVAALAALVVHHVALLRIPLDDYSPTRSVELLTSPMCEVALAIVAVATLGVCGARGRAPEGLPDGEYVDPGIYAVIGERHGLRIAPLGFGMAGAPALAVGVQVW
jgi:hypothetical protein